MATTDYDFQSTRDTIIDRAYHKIGAIPQGSAPTSGQITNAAIVLNERIKDLQNENIFLWALSALEVQLVLYQANYTIGSNANIIGIDAAYYRSGSGESQSDEKLRVITWREYQEIFYKAERATPQCVSISPTNGELYVWPVPTVADKVYGVFVSRLKDWDSAATTGGDFPSNFERALTYLLAADLGPEYRLQLEEIKEYEAIGMVALKKAVAIQDRITGPKYMESAY